MLYLVAFLIPPLGVIFAGKVFTGLILGVLWFVAVVYTFGLAHIVFIVLAWVIIASAKGDKRHKEILKGRE